MWYKCDTSVSVGGVSVSKSSLGDEGWDGWMEDAIRNTGLDCTSSLSSLVYCLLSVVVSLSCAIC